MSDIEMPPQYAGEDYYDPQDTERHVFRAIRGECADRLQMWETNVLTAIDQFETDAYMHITELEYEHPVEFPFGPVVRSFADVAISFFPPTRSVRSIVSGVMGGIQADYDGQLETSLSGAKAQLQRAIGTFVGIARKRTTDAATEVHEKLDDLVEDAMTWVDSATTDPAYVSAFCDWMGFPLPTDENSGNPVRQSMENPFFGIYQSIRAQLLRTQGVAGLDDDDLSPSRWEQEAIEHQRNAYLRDGPEAWRAVYDEVR